MRISALAALSLLMVCGSVQAQEASPHHSLDGRFRLGLTSNLLSYEPFTMKVGDALSLEVEAIGIGLQQQGGLGPIFSYGLSDDILLGASVILAHTNGLFFTEGSATRVSFEPSIEYVLGAGKQVRPFVGAALGLMIDWTSFGGMKMQLARVLFGAEAGAHCFIGDHVSLDPSLYVGYELGGGRSDDGYEQQSVTLHSPMVLLALGISYWS